MNFSQNQFKQASDSLKGMSDEQLQNMMKSMGNYLKFRHEHGSQLIATIRRDV
jgi:hypothetical protein